MYIEYPEYISTAVKLLEQSGYKAYAVGGCIRDALMNKAPNDWDMTTSSKPEETIEVFKNYRVIPTGLKHGTVTVIIDGAHIEITTMRIDGEYHDNRRPDDVEFTQDITQDLSRRDFTVNAIAYNHTSGITDPFCGREDIESRIIRCVGDPDKRFNEDALRIIRALRFASVLDFQIEKNTADSIRRNAHLLNNVAAERIRVELLKLLCGCAVERVLGEFKDVIFTVIPELRECDGFPQNTPFHIYDVWGHTLKVVAGVKNTPELRFAALLHDVAKPQKFYLDDKGVAHFKGHPELSAEIAFDIMKRLRFPNAEIKDICDIIHLHDTRPDGSKSKIARLCSEYSCDTVRQTLELMRGDAAGKNPAYYEEDIQSYALAEKQIDEIEQSALCLSVAELDVSGQDIMALGLKGREIGEILERLLQLVIDEKIENKKEVLLGTAKKLKNN